MGEAEVDASRPGAGDGVTTVRGRAALFGFDSSEIHVRFRSRDRSWRLWGAAQRIGLALVLAPLVGLLPPHAPWAMGALAAGAVLARRRWTETRTLLEVEGACPRCGHPFQVGRTPLREPHPLQCDGCHHVSTLELQAVARSEG